MTLLDYVLIFVVGLAAYAGFQRGLLQELLSLGAWFLAIAAIMTLHTPMTEYLVPYTGPGITTAVLAFAILLLIPYAAMKIIANNVGKASKGSVLGPIDKALGFGFGAVKGLVIVAIGFSLIVLAYDTIWGERGRPDWISRAASYDFLDASSRSMVDMVAERRARVRGEERAEDEQAET